MGSILVVERHSAGGGTIRSPNGDVLKEFPTTGELDRSLSWWSKLKGITIQETSEDDHGNEENG